MSTVDFHTHLADPIGYACRLLRKAVRSGQRVQLRAPAAMIARLDVALWTFSPLEFVAHAGEAASPAVQARSPVLLLDADAPPLGCDVGAVDARGVLVNMATPIDAGADWVCSHPRVIELVGNSEAELGAARQRYKQYRAHPQKLHTLNIHERTE